MGNNQQKYFDNQSKIEQLNALNQMKSQKRTGLVREPAQEKYGMSRDQQFFSFNQSEQEHHQSNNIAQLQFENIVNQMATLQQSVQWLSSGEVDTP